MILSYDWKDEWRELYNRSIYPEYRIYLQIFDPDKARKPLNRQEYERLERLQLYADFLHEKDVNIKERFKLKIINQ